MIGKTVNFLIEQNYTDIYAVLVFACVLLAVAWSILMRDDPANTMLPQWDLRLRRIGVMITVAGFMISVLFGGRMGWVPWPPAVLIVLGFVFYLSAAIFTSQRRMRIIKRFADLHRVNDDDRHKMTGSNKFLAG